MNNRGFTIPEAILATIIMVVSLFGLLRAYSFSTEYVERIGIRRQALSVIQQEYEKFRRYSHNGEFDLTPLIMSDKEIEFKNIFHKSERNVKGWLSTSIEEQSDESGLNCQLVNITLRYDYEDISDTIVLPGKFYRDKQR